MSENIKVITRTVKMNQMTIRIKSVFQDKISLEKAMFNIMKMYMKNIVKK